VRASYNGSARVRTLFLCSEAGTLTVILCSARVRTMDLCSEVGTLTVILCRLDWRPDWYSFSTYCVIVWSINNINNKNNIWLRCKANLTGVKGAVTNFGRSVPVCSFLTSSANWRRPGSSKRKPAGKAVPDSSNLKYIICIVIDGRRSSPLARHVLWSICVVVGGRRYSSPPYVSFFDRLALWLAAGATSLPLPPRHCFDRLALWLAVGATPPPPPAR
jgi:hypothetical protein